MISPAELTRWPTPMLDEEAKLRLHIAALYAQPRHSIARRLWDATVGKVCLYILNYGNRALDPHEFARLLEADLRALQDRRRSGGSENLARDQFVQERG